jgi:hypothetical protein
MTFVATKNRFKIAIDLVIILLVASAGAPMEAKAEFPQVFVYPFSQTVDTLRTVFTANVSISDVFNLYAYEFKLYYNSTVLNGTSVAEGPFLEENGQTPFFYVVAFTDHYNSTYGVVWVDSTLEGNVLGINGNGVLATIEFSATNPGNSIPLSLRDVKLSDPNSNPIPYVSFDGTVTVLPEFTGTTAILALILISIPILFITRKNAQNAKISSCTLERSPGTR